MIRLIAVGASLGGLEAVQTLLRGLPAGFRTPIVLVQHRAPQVDGHLVDLLNGRSSVPVVEPDDKDPLEAGHVYLAPAGYHLVVERGFLSLSLDPPVLFARPSIDVLFESAADSYGAAALAVLLTGSNEDGASGAEAIKRVGGRVVIQDPMTARAPAGPLAVLERVAVDGVIPLQEMSTYLTAVCGDTAAVGR